MRIEPLISKHLYLAKKVTLQNIGTFYLAPELILNTDPEKDISLPENAIRFEFNKNAQPDDSLLEYIMQETKKIKPLAASDLESYSILSIQFLNIGKALEIKGIGFLLKNQSGEYEFTQGDTIDNKLTDLSVHSEHTEESGSPNFSTPAKEKSKNKWLLPFSLIVLTFGVIIYLYLHYSNNNDTAGPVTPVTDTIVNKIDTTTKIANDSIIKASDTIKTHAINDSIISKDSTGN